VRQSFCEELRVRIGGGLEAEGPSRDIFLTGKDDGVIGPSCITSAAGARGPRRRSGLSLLGSITVGGGVSRESMRPMASMAPPSISVRSLSVAEPEKDGVRSGDRSGRRGAVVSRIGEGSGE